MYKNFMSNMGVNSVSSLQPPTLAPFTTTSTTAAPPQKDTFGAVNKWVGAALDWGQAGAGIYASFKQIENSKNQPILQQQPVQPIVQYVPPQQLMLPAPMDTPKEGINYIPFAIGGTLIVALVLLLVLKKK